MGMRNAQQTKGDTMRNNPVITSTNTVYYVRDRDTGGVYLTTRSRRCSNCETKYRWVKNKNDAATMSYDAAQKCRQRYGGVLVKATSVVVEEQIG